VTYLAIPNLGNYTIALKTAVWSLGIEAWASTATTRTAMKLGCEAAPESACLPFKAHIGHFIEAATSRLPGGIWNITECTGRFRG